ncbi:MAG: TetR/AcrR family transcriptional regulator [Desulfobacteraceae bacterium]|nr:TetR/AcrR family transcriptional regulator [Desulfobacteraceae bacterium]MBU4054283.1 TetR/AcrR family transcriptional regulator [Pseudomonadota bacterium]
MEKMEKSDRKQEILSAAIDLFGEKGFSRTPTSLIARKANVAEGLIFHYFKNKQGILVQILDDIIEEYLSGMDGASRDPGLTGMEVVEKFIRFHFELRERREKAIAVLHRELVSDIIAPGSEASEFLMAKWNKILEILKQALLKGREDGTIRDLPADATVLLIRGALMGVSNLYRYLPNIPNLQDMPDALVQFVRRSISSNVN